MTPASEKEEKPLAPNGDQPSPAAPPSNTSSASEKSPSVASDEIDSGEEVSKETEAPKDPPLTSILKKGRGNTTTLDSYTSDALLGAIGSDDEEDLREDLCNDSGDDDSESAGSGPVDVDDIKASTSSPPAPRVKFASSTSAKAVPPPSTPYSERTKEELIEIISDLKQGLMKVTVDRTAEKALRKKKEKSMIKMAKELSLRTADLVEREKHLAELEASKKDLMAKLESTKQELESLSDKYRQDANDRHAEVTTSQARYREACAKHDKLVADLNASNALQCEELRRRAITAELESDKLRIQLARLEMKSDPERAGEVVQRTIKESDDAMKTRNDIRRAEIMRENRNKFWKQGWQYGKVLFIVMFFELILFGYQRGLLSSDGLCAPCMPGKVLDKEAGTFDAPWWAPSSIKENAFRLTCRNRPRLRIDWSGGESKSNLVVTNINAVAKGQRSVKEKKGKTATIGINSITLMQKTGKNETLNDLWTTSTKS